MPIFKAKIGAENGKVIEREFEAASRESLLKDLEREGNFVFCVKRLPFHWMKKLEKGNDLFSGRDFLSFNQQFLVLIRSGLPILKVFDILIEKMESGKLRRIFLQIREEINGGASLSEALAKFPRQFPPLFLASVEAGEHTGDLIETMGRFIAYQRRIEEIKARVRSASFYPAILVSFTVIVLVFLLLWVVPRFSQIYADAQADLPLVTRILVAAASSLVTALPGLIAVGIGAVFAFVSFVRTPRGKLHADRLRLRVPFLGHLQIHYSVSNFCRTLSTVLGSGIPLVRAMKMSCTTLNNSELENRLSFAIRRVEEGRVFSAAVEETRFFPLIAMRMIGVGESTGALGQMLGDVSDYYESQVEEQLGRITTIIEPVMMLGMGLLVGGIVVAMYVPIFQLAGAVG